MLGHYGALIELQHLRDEEEAAINREDMNAASARQAAVDDPVEGCAGSLCDGR
jgi:hypothetical protein